MKIRLQTTANKDIIELERNEPFTLEELVSEYQAELPYRVLLATVNGVDRELTTEINKDAFIILRDMRTNSANLAYQRSLTMMYLVAVRDVLDADADIDNSLNKGLYTDIKGKKIRANNASLMIDTVNAMGASAVPMAYTEVYSALKQGTIEGLENIPAGFNSTSMSEVAPYYAMTRHITSSMMVVMNEQAWDAMSEEDKEIFREASADTQEFARKTAEEYEEKALKELEEKGVMINEVDDIEEWAEALKPVTEKYGEGYEDIVAEIDALSQE